MEGGGEGVPPRVPSGKIRFSARAGFDFSELDWARK